jgi:hypothetical protein
MHPDFADKVDERNNSPVSSQPGRREDERLNRGNMARAEHIISELQKGPFGQAGEVLAQDGDLEVRVQLADWDRLGCRLEKLEMKDTQGHFLKLDPTRLEKELTYLGEPLRIVELEKHRGKAILRSFPPRRENGTVSFFEMVLDGPEGLSLTRLAYDRMLGQRSAVPVSLTRDTLERLLADLVDLASTH